MSEEQLRVLVVDDEESFRVPLRRHLENAFRYAVDDAACSEGALRHVAQAERAYDVALIDDLLLPGPGAEPQLVGIDLMRRIRQESPDTECIVLTGWGMDRALEALRAGAYRYLAKPPNLDELGMTIRMAAEHRHLKRQLAMTQEEKEWLQTFLEIGKAATSVLELDDVLERIHEQVGRLMDTSGLDVVLYDEKSQTLRFELGYDRGEREARWERPFTAGQGLTDWVIEHREPLLIRDHANEPAPAPAYQRGEPSRSWLGIPLVARDRVIGAITVQSYEPHQFDETHQQILAAVGNHVAGAIEHAWLFSELAEAQEWREALIENAFDAVIAIDQDARITVFNRRAEDMFGWTAEEMVGGTVARLHVDWKRARRIFETVDEAGSVSGWRVELTHRNGTRFPALLSATQIRDSRGRAIGQAGFMRDLQQLRLYENRLHALIRVSQAITEVLDPDEVLELVVDSAVAVFPAAQKGSIHLFDERTGKLHIRASRGYSPEVVDALTLEVGEGRAGWVYQHGAPLVIGNVQDDVKSGEVDRRVQHPEVQEQKSAICVPLAVGDRVIGTLSLDNITAVDAFKAEDLGLLSIFASQAAVALVNAELMAKNQERLGKLEMLSRASNEMMSNLRSMGLDERLNLTLRHIAQILDAEACAILLVQKPGYLTVEASYGHRAGGFQKGQRVAIRSEEGAGLTGHIACTGQPFKAHGAALAEHWAAKRTGPHHLASGRCHSMLAIPLKRNDGRDEKLVGLLKVENKVDADGLPKPYIGFTDEDQWILRIFAETVAISLENAELFGRTSERLAEKVVSLKAIQETSAAIGAELDRDQLLDLITEKAAAVFAASASSLMLWDRGERDLAVKAQSGLSERYRAQSISKEAIDGILASMEGLGPVATEDLRITPFGRLELIEAEGLCSALSIPLVVAGKFIGILNIYTKEQPRQFTLDEIELGGVFANQAAGAIRNAQLYEQVQRRAHVLQALYDAGQTLAASLDTETVLDHLVQHAQRLTKRYEAEAVFGDIMLVEDDKLNFVAAFPEGALDDARRRFGASIDLKEGIEGHIGITGRAVQTGRSQLVADVSRDPDYYRAHSGRTLSELAVPIKHGRDVIGVVNVEHAEASAFDEEDQKALESLAAQAAIAIENARLYEQQQQEAERLALINTTAAEISSSLDLEEVLQALVDRLAGVLGVEQCAIALFDQEREYGHVIAEYLEPGCVPSKGWLIPLRDNPSIEQIRSTRQPLVVRDAQGDPLLESVWDIMKQRRTESIMLVPIVREDEVIGTIGLDSVGGRRDFTNEERWLAETIARHAAIAIGNARLYEELRRAYEDLKLTRGLIGARTALAWMGMASSAWRHTADKHALTIREQAELLRRDWEAMPTPPAEGKVLERIDTIERLATHILDKPITPPLSSEAGVEDVSLSLLAGERASQLWENDPYKGTTLRLDLQLPGEVTVWASPQWLRRALDILVDNAVEAVAGCDLQQVMIGTRATNDGAAISVSDTGRGIPEDIQAKIGYELIEKPEDAQGLGMGLLMAQTILQTYGGYIDVHETGPTGTTMDLWLPLQA